MRLLPGFNGRVLEHFQPACAGALWKSGRSGSRCRSADIEHEVEATGDPALRVALDRRLGGAHDQLAPEQAVALVLVLAGKIDLGRHDASARRLQLDVDVAG